MLGRRVTKDFSVSPQITVQDVSDIAAAGFKSIVCNRPDGESLDQTPFADIEAAAKAVDLRIVWQPIANGGLVEADGERFREIVADLPKPVLAYCTSGTRCMILWSLSQATSRSSEEILRAAAEAGYDLRGLAPRLDAIKSGAQS